ncbi:hypothetical protein CONPUDRAFT_47531 [Coniophora puteana RWD-64-598 SS2]|uniref:DNA polymerase V n=1 Tax=Coniophora puteana (strain RWD-64-598) TaxID=741705 RepID=A0A5M3N243_CONPW|nr:uncharacterized protein CONPUDRAFT_47531 [Coniophora puteana RWD-64-598 SS2]EIW84995.1 hypothetical protein CONPUDRAFT_47531 [Coniophora puteana RWD-64-598 SS2]
MSTTLPLFWDLSSNSKKDRLDASVKLVSSLERFQASHVAKAPSDASDEDEDGEDVQNNNELDALNAEDVTYSIRRLIRGLASPRESSRLGFAVTLTELLSMLDTVTCSQIVKLIVDASKTQGSMTGQEERDVLFARLFGLTTVIQSGLLVRDTLLPSSPSSTTHASSLDSCKEVVDLLVALGKKKSWLRESAWWTLGLTVDVLRASSLSWKEDALDHIIQAVFEEQDWTPDKVAVTLKLQSARPQYSWNKRLAPKFKDPDLLSTSNLVALGRVLKTTCIQEAGDDSSEKATSAGAWKPQLHFVWNVILDRLLPPSDDQEPQGSVQEFFRVVVDESLFSTTSSAERKYSGFQVFSKALPRVKPEGLPMLFTTNFMRTWINHLSNNDRHLHKIAIDVAKDIQAYVQKNPTMGMSLILQLTGVNGNRQFDKLTRTKTVESILSSMDNDGIQKYIDFLLAQVNDPDEQDFTVVNAKRAWICDQFANLIRNGAIPKSDDWVQLVLDWFTVHGLFAIKKKTSHSPVKALQSLPSPAFSDELRQTCRQRLLTCLAELTNQVTVIKTDDKAQKRTGVASDGEFWVAKVVSAVRTLQNDSKHATILQEVDEEDVNLREKAFQAIERLQKACFPILQTRAIIEDDTAKGAELLLSASLLDHYCSEDEEAQADTIQTCLDAISRMFPESKKKKTRKSKGAEDENQPEPIDVLVDTLIGFLEKSTAYFRSVSNQVFASLCGAVQESTIDLILEQLERRDPQELAADEGEDEDVDEDMDDEDEGDEEAESDVSDEDEDEDEDDSEGGSDDEAAQELRRKIEEALKVNGIGAAEGDSDESEEELMDDDQMMAIDGHLAEIFRSQTGDKKAGKAVDLQREATHFKNRVLDLVDTFIKKNPSSPHNIRIVLPLVELATKSGSDERQLSDKATGLLKSHLAKSKDVPSVIDAEKTTTIFKELHERARRVPGSDALSVLSQCSLYISRVLQNGGQEQAIVDLYQESLLDFTSRKASRLNFNFFQDYIRRFASLAWQSRSTFLSGIEKAVNAYRKCQTFQLLQTLLSQQYVVAEKEQFLSFMPALRDTIYETIVAACKSDKDFTAAQIKDILKLGLQAIRQTRKVDSSKCTKIWKPSLWEELHQNLASSERFKTSTNLLSMCKQMQQTAKVSETAASKKAKKAQVNGEEGKPAKRKVDQTIDSEVVNSPKPKRKKQKN